MAERKKKKSRAGPGASESPSRATARQQPLTHKDVMEASIRIDPALRRRSELLWEDRSKPTRGPKASLTPDDVVRAAMEIADEEGLAALTMQAVSARLGFTTMAVYRYFPSKEALYDAIVDAGMGQPPHPPEPRGDWRAELTQWAHAKRAMLCSRPWLAELPFVAAPHGPNWLSWLEAAIGAMSSTSLTGEEKGQMLSILDGYTRGASDTAISLARARARGISEQEWAAAVGADLGRAIGDPRFPAFASLIASAAQAHNRTMEESFDFGLQRILDGIELYIERQG